MAGPLKVFLAGRVAVEANGRVLAERDFPGRQGRLLFAYLAAEKGRAVPKDELAEVLWGESPPRSWNTALTVLVSKLRALLAASGVDGASALSSAFGCYRLEFPDGSTVDVLEAESATQEAESLLGADDWERATASAARGESLLRESFLPGEDGTWVEAKRRELADVRARALSVLADASLSSGNPEQSVRWAEQSIEAEPFREGGYRRLMEAHATAGNRAEALRAYERCRRLLAEELGAYPSPETESIYRSLLEAPSGGVVVGIVQTALPQEITPLSANRRRLLAVGVAAFVILVSVVTAGAAIVVATRGSKSGARTARVALVVPRSPPVSDDPFGAYRDAVDRARTKYGVQTRIFPIDLSKPVPTGVLKSIGNFDLVLLAGQFVSARFVHEIARHPHTRFVVIDPDPSRTAADLYRTVSTLPNATDIFFVEGPPAAEAGYLAALMAKSRDPGKRPVISLIAGDPVVNSNAVAGFETGAKAAAPRAIVLEDFSYDFQHPSACAKIANSQIDAGSTVVFADAGACSTGALSAAGGRRIWGIGANQDLSNPPSYLLGSTVKRLDRAVEYSIRQYVEGLLPPSHLDIGIAHEAAGFEVAPGRAVPALILAKLAQFQQEKMKSWTSREMPLKCDREGAPGCGGGTPPS